MSKHKKPEDNVKRSRQVHETNQWVEAKKGQRFAPGTYVDSHGVLRASSDGSCAVWHSRPRIRERYGLTGRCERRGIRPDQIVYDPATGAPWCDECWPWEVRRQAEDRRKAREKAIKTLFGEN